ncbi:phosphotransferase family protein [Ktedonobacter racemifer]|uniref:Aminoglycoside phosphotransferase n=1 Tax=Ktedonobacter racemifer DSM 44963 TaxID=485913 RepID=D6U148_KTERA|nr:aminoglycoside phosphotransferase family protein [Ktedonobacter racemifer]EFH82538.1 aminoglycoside phosphotransferase [Ktedonobacter racemifer DSM 44963]
MNYHYLELAASNILARLTGPGEPLKPLYLQHDRAIFLAEGAHIILKVYSDVQALRHDYEIAQQAASVGLPTPEILAFEAGPPAVFAMRQVIGIPLSSRYPDAAREAGVYLRCLHGLGAQPPFSGGQHRWEEFILWWANLEIEHARQGDVLNAWHASELRERFERLRPLLARRPIGLLHGDLQNEHILLDPQSQKVLAFLDFIDAQPGDPLLDIAVLTLWDQELTDPLLEGYEGYGTNANNAETQHLLTHYRLLRLLGSITWLLNRGFHDLAAKYRNALELAIEA